MAVLALFFTGCNDDNDSLEEEQAKVDMSDFYLYTNPTEDGTTPRVSNSKNCASMEVLNRQSWVIPTYVQHRKKFKTIYRK
mgnify:CR=1 FL=1